MHMNRLQKAVRAEIRKRFQQLESGLITDSEFLRFANQIKLKYEILKLTLIVKEATK